MKVTKLVQFGGPEGTEPGDKPRAELPGARRRGTGFVPLADLEGLADAPKRERPKTDKRQSKVSGIEVSLDMDDEDDEHHRLSHVSQPSASSDSEESDSQASLHERQKQIYSQRKFELRGPSSNKEVIAPTKAVDIGIDAEDMLMVYCALMDLVLCVWMKDHQVLQILEGMEMFELEKGELLCQRNDIAMAMYIVHEGSLEVLSEAEEVVVVHQRAGVIGDESLLRAVPRSHTIRAAEKTVVYALDSVVFRDHVRGMMTDQVAETRQYVENVPCFKMLTSVQKDMLAQAAVYTEYADGEILFRQGDVGDGIYLLRSGETVVLANDITVWRYTKAGDFFGERALLASSEKRAASVKSLGDSSCFKILAKDIDRVFGSDLETVLSQNLLQTHLSCTEAFAEVPFEVVQALSHRGKALRFNEGDIVVSAGQDEYKGLYFVQQGQLGAMVEGQPLTFGDHQHFGEEYLVDPDTPFIHTVICQKPETRVLRLTVEDMRSVIETKSLRDEVAYHKTLRLIQKIFIFRHLDMDQLRVVASSFEVKKAKAGDVVMAEGEMGDSMALVIEGSAAISKDGVFITTKEAPTYIGDRALLYDEPRTATITISSEDALLWVLSKQVFLDIVGTAGLREHLEQRNRIQNGHLRFEDLFAIKVIGQGGFGIVKLVEHVDTKVQYALKCVRRDKLNAEEKRALLSERQTMIETDHPMLLNMIRTYRDNDNVYFLLEVASGGELLDAMEHLGLLTKKQTQFYIGCLVLVFEYFLDQHIVYRDLKPENILLDNAGYVKLIDFGLAKKLTSAEDRTFTLVGTPQFMAPEVIKGQGFGFFADIWSIGICAFEFMVGRLPFGEDCESQKDIFRQTLRSDPVMPRRFDEDARDLIMRFLRKRPEERLGSGRRGYTDIKDHPFFGAMSWDELIHRRIEPPYIPAGENYCESTPIQQRLEPLVLTLEDDWAVGF